MAITDRGMQAKPAAKDRWLSESFGRGSGVFLGRITPAGERVFYFRYTDSKGGRPFLPVGAFSSSGEAGGLTVADARKKASAWSLLYRNGTRDLREHFEQERRALDAATQRQRLAAEAEYLAATRRLTIRQLFDRWEVTELTASKGTDGKRKGRKDGGAYIRALFEKRLFPTLGPVAAADVRKADLMTVLDAAVGEGRRRTGNVLLASMKQMFRFALARDIVDRNPLDTITKRDVGGTETTRDRVLSAEEVKALAKALPGANLNERSAIAIWLILATGCRISEAMGAGWEHVDTSACTWYLPTTKNERDHTVHLSAFALRQFDALHDLRGSSPWVFPNTRGTGPVCVKSFGKQLADRQREPDRRMQHRTQLTTSLVMAGGRWTAHDLRRTAATMMAELGISGDVIDECLNHVIESRMRRTYIRNRRLPEQARAFDALGKRLDALTSGRDDTKVTRLRAAK